MRHLLLKATTVEQKKQSQKEDERINVQEMFSLSRRNFARDNSFSTKIGSIPFILMKGGQPYIITRS